ncbi:MAG: hypothetical protein OXL41_00820 [Nitrospinae bacterium]|nr:hypothetical protein [Nitrospinota bacterium]
MMNASFLAYGAMAIGAAAITWTSLYNLGTAGALFLFLNPIVNIEVAFGDTRRSISYDKLALLALALGFAWHVLRNSKHARPKSQPIFCYIWLACIAWSLVAAWLSGAPPEQQFWGLAETIAYFITFLVFQAICADDLSRNRMLKAILYGGFIMLAAVLFQNLAYQLSWKIWGPRYAFRADLLYSPFTRTFFDSRPGPIGHPNFLAAYLVLWAALYPYLFRMFSRPAALAIIAMHLIVLALTGSYGGVFGFGVCCSVVLFFTKPIPTNMTSGRISRTGGRLLRHFLAAFLILAIGAVAANDEDFLDLSLFPRIYIYRVGGKMLADRPLTGHGNGLFPQAFQKSEREYIDNEGLSTPPWRVTHDEPERAGKSRDREEERTNAAANYLPPLSAHSSYLKAFVETGFPGGILFLCLIVGGLIEVFAHLRKTMRLSIRSPEAWGWAACIGVCFQAGAENIFSSPKISVLFWAVTAYCLTAKPSHSENPE